MSFCKFWDCEDNILRYILFFVLECSPSQSPPNVSLVCFFFHCILVSPASSTLTRSTAIFIHVGFSLVSIFPDISLLCFWPVYWLFRLYVHDASNEIHVSIRDFIYPDVLSVVACCFCCNFCVARFLFFPDTSILLLFMGDCLLYMIVCLGINQFLLNCTRSTSIGYNRTSRHPY